MAEPSVYETNRRATVLGLSFAQMYALQWLAEHSPAYRVAWRGAGIAVHTIYSLHLKGLADDNGAAYRISEAGKAAMAKAIGGMPAPFAPPAVLGDPRHSMRTKTEASE